ncbi:DUF3592 domain-containing protein [Micromonospora sp. DT47]|uniref:DUF3592 domain-containing protein n=1 Tax=Micromonospora sp. DT47 TaxID=3393431 RepID=UPI003CF11AB0
MTDEERPPVRRRLAWLGRRLARRAVLYPTFLLLGAALLYVPVDNELRLDRWRDELREHGQPTQAVVYDQVTKPGGNKTGASSTMYFRYDLDGVTHEQEVACFEVCLPPGTTASIWVSRTDPGDFVTDFDQLSGHRGRIQGVVGAVGFGVLALTVGALVTECLGWWQERRRRPRPRALHPVSLPRSKHKSGGGRRLTATRRR